MKDQKGEVYQRFLEADNPYLCIIRFVLLQTRVDEKRIEDVWMIIDSGDTQIITLVEEFEGSWIESTNNKSVIASNK